MRTFTVTGKAIFGNSVISVHVQAHNAELAEASVTMRFEAAGYYIVSVR